ncbi:hypothetical protein CAP48_08310 [Advenella sp. S44]|uniref:hypothetical protein n=1 Tax=Advenella sp. S44 TaxID=1982755 RepID=UPI000C2ACAE6|nr:hypothetical protein [Advenella sp. S44]PJX26014.1 hypothetical protein CAP48_08310 [Advenella sp. S44]
MDDLILKAKRLTDKAERIKFYKEVQKVFHEQIPMSPMATAVDNVPMRKNVAGFWVNPFGKYQFFGVSLK